MKSLIEKYYAGQTSEEEELRLKAWLLDGGEHGEHEADSVLLSALQEAANEGFEPPMGMNARLERLIDHAAEAERRPQTPKKAKTLRRVVLWASGVAACVAVALTAIPSGGEDNVVEITDPELAGQYTQMALTKFSRAYNRGLSKLDKCRGSMEKMRLMMQAREF